MITELSELKAFANSQTIREKLNQMVIERLHNQIRKLPTRIEF